MNVSCVAVEVVIKRHMATFIGTRSATEPDDSAENPPEERSDYFNQFAP
jgi:hypothetical protein